jgi:hypothetical protein
MAAPRIGALVTESTTRPVTMAVCAARGGAAAMSEMNPTTNVARILATDRAC